MKTTVIAQAAAQPHGVAPGLDEADICSWKLQYFVLEMPQ